MRSFSGAILHFYSSILMASLAQNVNADAFSSAHLALEKLKNNCYPDIDAEILVAPEISDDGVVTKVTIGEHDDIDAYIVNPQRLRCGIESPSLCGTRGCSISIFAGDDRYSYVGGQPKALRYNNVTLLLIPHSAWACGRTPNSELCLSILSWDANLQRLVTVTQR